ncbi:MAG: sigma-70 family RNA polymerase sigma factor [Verrucomicrobiales bacterium]|nr:sigma-70 family RNA polymerase sigma factor [Verrucomicrobiales bacterium]
MGPNEHEGERVSEVWRRKNFPTTHWSVVLAAGDPHAPNREQALAALCRTYWYPLYGYVRGCGLSPEDAQDITQSFFGRLMEADLLARADRGRGRFRWFLLKSLQNFLRNEITRAEAQKRGGGRSLVSWDALEAEQRYTSELVDHGTADVIFDRRWARAVMEQALDKLTLEFSRSGRRELFERLRVYLASEVRAGEYANIASDLGLSTAAVKVTVHRVRQRYREIIRSEIAHTVSDPADVDDELRHLAQLLSA